MTYETETDFVKNLAHKHIKDVKVMVEQQIKASGRTSTFNISAGLLNDIISLVPQENQP